MKVFAPLLFLVVLASCSLNQVDAYKAVLTACNGYNTSLVALAGFKAEGSLTESEIATVDLVRPIARGICDRESPPLDMGSALDAIEDIAFRLLTIETRVKSNG